MAEALAQWDAIRTRVLGEDPAQAGLVTALRPVAVSGKRLSLIPIADGLALDQLGDAARAHRLLLQALRAALGSGWDLAPLPSTSFPSTPGVAGEDPAYRAAQEHPLVRELLRRFDGEIITRERMRER